MTRFSVRGVTMAFVSAATSVALIGVCAADDKKYDLGASDAAIKVGNIMPYSGPASAYGTIGRAMTAYFRMVNDRGGINGRKVDFVSYDDAYSPPKTVEQARRLVESDEVLLVAGSFGTAGNAAIQRYLNQKHVPQRCGLDHFLHLLRRSQTPTGRKGMRSMGQPKWTARPT